MSFFVGSVQGYFSVKLGHNPSTLKMESACIYETPVFTCENLRYENPGDLTAKNSRLENVFIYPYNKNQQEALFTFNLFE